MRYKQLATHQRYQIFTLLELGFSYRKIASKIGVSHTTISREIQRNSIYQQYNPENADLLATDRQSIARKHKSIDTTLENFIVAMLKIKYSPQMIALILTHFYDFKLSFQSIYNHIEYDRFRGGELYKLLPLKGRAKRPNKNYKPSLHGFNDRTSISSRPLAANHRKRIGDLEIDTIIGHNRTGGVVTIVDRKSRYIWAEIVPNLSSKTVSKAILKMLKPHKAIIKTITSDNGREFADFKNIAKTLGCKYYFADPYASWQRGTIERMNREIRLFYPKRFDFLKLDKQSFQDAIHTINLKPRICLNLRSPFSTFTNQEEFWSQCKVVHLLLESRHYT